MKRTSRKSQLAELKARGFKSPAKTLASIKRGLAESAQGKTVLRSSPNQWAKGNLDKLATECAAKGLHSIASSLRVIADTLDDTL